MPEGIANLMIPVAWFMWRCFRGLETGIAVPGFYSHQLDCYENDVLRWHEENGTLLYGRTEDE